MNPRVHRAGNFARKKPRAGKYPDPGVLVARSQLLTAAGVRTPVATHESATGELVFPWIEGMSGRSWLAGELERISGKCWRDIPDSVLRPIIGPLASLHSAPPEGLALQPLDPWRKISPRLVHMSEHNSDQLTSLATAAVDAARASLGKAVQSSPRTTPVPVHGDYHVGQLLMTNPTEPWLLDLEDMALGPGESDLGNMMAHLQTSEGLVLEAIAPGFLQLSGRIQEIYSEATGASCKLPLIMAYGATALVRRALKLHEQGKPPSIIIDILSAARELAAG